MTADPTPPGTRYDRPVRYAYAALAGTYLLAGLTGVIGFRLWDQILFILHRNLDEIGVLTTGHGLRHVLLYPLIHLHRTTGIDLDYLFTILVMVLVLGIGASLSRAHRHVYGPSPIRGLPLLAFTAFWVVLSLFMNGRLALAFFGLSLVLATLLRWQSLPPVRRPLLDGAATTLVLLAGLWFTAVSSGTLLVALVTVYATVAVTLLRGKGAALRRDPVTPVVLLGLVAIAVPVLGVLIRKNVDFYGGGYEGALNMLNHGPGFVLYGLGPEVAAVLYLLFAVAVAAGVLRAWRRHPLLAPVLFAVGAAAVVGMFGYSTLAMGLPPGLIILAGWPETPRRLLLDVLPRRVADLVPVPGGNAR